MLILCCDTASDSALFTLADEYGRVVASIAEVHHRSLSAGFYAAVDAVLNAAGVTFDQVDGFAAGIGPGSFTGVRITVTSLRTLAQVTGRPLVGVCTLDLYAEPFLGAGRTVAAVLPSRRNELYVGIYAPGTERELLAMSPRDAAARFAQAAIGGVPIVCGPASARPEGFNGDYRAVEAPPADAMARLAAAEFAAGRLADPLGLNPLYVVAPAIHQHLSRP